MVHYEKLMICFNNAAQLAVQHGAAGIIVSNHGARQLDYVPATIMALEEVAFASLKFPLSLISDLFSLVLNCRLAYKMVLGTSFLL